MKNFVKNKHSDKKEIIDKKKISIKNPNILS